MTILFVHPHPDDESLLTGGLILHAHARGRRVVVVTATRGQEGWGGASVRSRELEEACARLGVDRLEVLGFRDSGLGVPPRPDAFSALPLAEAAAPIAQILREERPEVVVTATPDGTYGHPDHVRAHDATMAALDTLRAEGWTPATVAMVAFPHGAAELVVHALLAFGRRPSAWLLTSAAASGLAGTAVRFTVLGGLWPGKRAAILAHRSQLRGWFGLMVRAPGLCRLVFGAERYLVADGVTVTREARSLFTHA